MSLPAWIAAIGGGLIVWGCLSTTAAVVLGRMMARRDKAEQPPPAGHDWPDESPFDLEGYALDAKYYAVIAEAWQ